MNERIAQTLDKADVAQKSWNELYSHVSMSGLQVERSYPAIQSSTLKELNDRLNSTFVIAESLRSLDDSAAILVCPRLASIDGPFTQIQQQAEAALAQIRQYPDATMEDPSVNLNVRVLRGGSVVTNLNLGPQFELIAGQQMVVLDQLTLALRFGRYKGIGLFHERAREMQGMSAELTLLLEEGKSAISQLKELMKAAQTSSDQCSEAEEVALEHKDQVLALVPETQRAMNEIESKLAHIKQITQAASSLSTQVDDYEASFAAFQESLDNRVQAHDKFVAEMKFAAESNSKREAAIEGLIAQADTMIKGATTAGLSKSLDEAKASYEERLHKTEKWFLGSVAVLLICLAPIAGQLIPGPWQEWFNNSSNATGDPWLSAIGKFIWLLPATWATAFFARNYAELFHLHREYAHKAAMAKAIDGFKREAPEYKEEIVAGVFMEIRDNPGSRKAPSPATPESPITKKFFSKVLEAIQQKNSAS